MSAGSVATNSTKLALEVSCSCTITADDIAVSTAPGSVVVDLASETGGNVEGSVSGEEILVGQVTVWGAKDVASEMPVHASQLYAMNIAALAGLLVKEGEFVVDLEDEVLDGCAVVHDGEVRRRYGCSLVISSAGVGSFLVPALPNFLCRNTDVGK